MNSMFITWSSLTSSFTSQTVQCVTTFVTLARRSTCTLKRVQQSLFAIGSLLGLWFKNFTQNTALPRVIGNSRSDEKLPSRPRADETDTHFSYILAEAKNDIGK